MATATIRNLWPEIKVNATPPYAILQSQTAWLSKMTQGLLRAEVVSFQGTDKRTLYQLDLIAPLLDSYRHTLLTIEQLYESAYPVKILEYGQTDYIDKAHGDHNTAVSLPPQKTSTRFRDNLRASRAVLSDEEDFIARIESIFQSPQTKGLIYALVARSEAKAAEQQDDQKTEDFSEPRK